MRFNDFVDALFKAGWRDDCDAQHTEVRKLWKRLFPTVAELEDELDEYSHTN